MHIAALFSARQVMEEPFKILLALGLWITHRF